jgi:hypothetical protein
MRGGGQFEMKVEELVGDIQGDIEHINRTEKMWSKSTLTSHCRLQHESL